MVLNAAAQVLREADDLKQKILKCNCGISMLQDRSLWTTQQQLQKAYQKVLTLDLDYALEKKVEQDLWNIGFKLQIEALQAISKDRKNAQRSEAQAMLSWVLQASAGFYLCLLHQICTTFKLDLPFRRRASLVGAVEGWEASAGGVTMNISAGVAAARYACQHCLVHLGDLARYRQQLKVAHTFYRHALAVSAHSGQPYNQLALVAWRRGRRLAALYWHVRSLLVRAPFPPAPANLARTLAAAAGRDGKEALPLPVLSGAVESKPASVSRARLDSHSYVTELLRALHCLHTLDQLESATELVNTLNSSLSPLIATDSFDSLTLTKMACVIIWIVHSTTENLAVEMTALSDSEATAAQLAASLAAATVLALLLPAYTADRPPAKALPTLKVFLQWIVCNPKVVRSNAWKSRPQLWAALGHVFNKLAETASLNDDKFDLVPLPEDEELNGFLPLEGALKGLKFASHAAWRDLPDAQTEGDTGVNVSSLSLVGEPELEQRVRAHRILSLGKQLSELFPEYLTYTEDEDTIVFTASEVGGEQLTQALQSLTLARAETSPPPAEQAEGSATGPPPPVIISEADFREKVREKRVGILKPQGSLERAREERALATTHTDSEEAESSESAKVEDKKESRKPRVNIAMAAIMRKQEETNKQVKFVTPPPTPDSTRDANNAKDDKPKVIQPKAIKSLANLPVGRKTGGILSLKDKSAGYPHLVNAEPEPKKPEKDDKKDPKPAQTNQNQQKKQDMQWNSLQNYTEAQRMNYHKNYGIQNAGISYNPNYQPPTSNQGIRLPVVNPKEIDVRTAALQKQSSRQEMFQDGHKFANQNYPVSGDKKNFLNDLPPRFANQYRYWQAAQEHQSDNKFKDENFKSDVFPQRTWPAPDQNYQQPISWWKPDQPSYSNYSAQPLNMPSAPNYFSQLPSTNPYQNAQYNQIPGQNVPNLGQNVHNLGQNGQSLPKTDLVPNHLQSSIARPQLPIQNMGNSPNFTSLNSLTYNPSVGYDAAMYPQFKFGYQPMQMLEKPFQNSKEFSPSFGTNSLDQRGLGFNEPFGQVGAMTPSDNIRVQTGSVGAGGPGDGNTYSLFSGAPDSAPAAHLPAQSLWSGPGSPLERLLEQQKQNKHPPAPR